MGSDVAVWSEILGAVVIALGSEVILKSVVAQGSEVTVVPHQRPKEPLLGLYPLHPCLVILPAQLVQNSPDLMALSLVNSTDLFDIGFVALPA